MFSILVSEAIVLESKSNVLKTFSLCGTLSQKNCAFPITIIGKYNNISTATHNFYFKTSKLKCIFSRTFMTTVNKLNGRTYANKANDIQTLLAITDNQAKTIVQKYPNLLKANFKSLLSTFTILRENQISVERIIANPWLLLIKSDVLNDSVDKVRSILPIKEFEVAIAFLQLSFSKMHEISVIWKYESQSEEALKGKFLCRLDFLAYNLQTSTTEVADMMAKVNKLYMIPFKRLQTVLTTLQEGGIETVDIIRDPWIFQHNVKTMKERLKESKDLGLPVIKPWMLRCGNQKFESFAERATKEQALLQGSNNDIGVFLQKTLGLSQPTVQEVLQRLPMIKSYSAAKLNEMIVFLHSEGFTANDIIDTPRIFAQKVETVSHRLKQLSEYKYELRSLSILCQNAKHFSRLINRLSKNKKASEQTQCNSFATNKMVQIQNDRKVR